METKLFCSLEELYTGTSLRAALSHPPGSGCTLSCTLRALEPDMLSWIPPRHAFTLDCSLPVYSASSEMGRTHTLCVRTATLLASRLSAAQAPQSASGSAGMSTGAPPCSSRRRRSRWRSSQAGRPAPRSPTPARVRSLAARTQCMHRAAAQPAPRAGQASGRGQSPACCLAVLLVAVKPASSSSRLQP